jgi:N-formylglutamate amidohydrolase
MKPMKPKCRLIGENGNIFNLMGIVSQTLKQAGEPEKADEMVKRITTEAKSYNEALAMLMEYVDVE